jgi:hypothetical protein
LHGTIEAFSLEYQHFRQSFARDQDDLLETLIASRLGGSTCRVNQSRSALLRLQKSLGMRPEIVSYCASRDGHRQWLPASKHLIQQKLQTSPGDKHFKIAVIILADRDSIPSKDYKTRVDQDLVVQVAECAVVLTKPNYLANTVGVQEAR